MVLCNN